ncbi:MAG: 6-phosphogluconolactonase [Opitutaceae bacterium]|nr:6-phosphogluconolactonase [Opitutaceae bacterium]
MRELSTEQGTVRSGPLEAVFAEAARLGTAAWRGAPGGRLAWALTGGSTPKAWYRWCTANSALTPMLLQQTDWYVSDERCVPLASEESNFGNADRLLFVPNGVPPERKHPWAVQLAPEPALADFTRQAAERFGSRKGFDLCFLGLGDDALTASLFPGSALLTNDGGALFAAVAVPGRGDRLTITPSGLRACGRIVVMATGEAKAEAVRRIFRGDESVAAVPAKVLASCAGRVVWLLDDAAAAGLGGG